VAAKTFDVAIGHYTKALGNGADDAACLGERGYASLLAGDLENADRDLWFAAGSAGDAAAHASIWYNLGLLADERGQPERARVAFARSLALRDTPQARKKLGTRSPCVVEVKTPPKIDVDGRNPVGVVAGWRGVAAFLGCERATEGEARALLCAPVAGDKGFFKPDCDGAPPWHTRICEVPEPALVVPLTADRFFVQNRSVTTSFVEGCPAKRVYTEAIHGPVIAITSTWVWGRHYDVDGSCRYGPMSTTITVFRLSDAEPLLEVTADQPDHDPVKIDPAGHVAGITATGCGQDIKLN